MLNSAPLILDIKGNALDDGPGIRSVVFFKGCLLDCQWCHNPESISRTAEISFESQKCLGRASCEAACEKTCSQQAISHARTNLIDRDRCTLCYQCVDACPSTAIAQVGEPMSVDDLYQKLVKYKPFYDSSGGGVTLSGGEPTLHMDYVSALLKKLKAQGIHTLLQTCGLFPFDKFMARLYPWLDAIYFDLKLYDDQRHRDYCGTSNKVILSNFVKLQALSLEGGVELLARTPLVPGKTDSESNLKAIASFLKQHKVTHIELVRYNPIWHDKRTKLGYQDKSESAEALKKWMSQTSIDQCEAIFHDAGLLTQK